MPAFAATAYTVRRSGSSRTTSTFSVVAEPGRARATATSKTDGPILYDSLLWIDSSLIAMNSQMQTWYEIERPFAIPPSFLDRMRGEKRVEKLVFTLNEVPEARPGEHHYNGKLRFVIRHSYTVTYTATLDIVTTDAVDSKLWIPGLLPRTGLAQVDEKLDAAELAIKGFPLRMSMTAGRQYSGGGVLMTELHEVEVSDIGEVRPDEKMFVRPAGYLHQKPIIAVPGT